MAESRLTFSLSPEGWVIDGELDRYGTAVLRTWYESIETASGPRTLDLAGLEILDAEGMTAAIDAIRWLSSRTPTLTIAYAPQLLSHALYRIGILGEGRLRLHAPRQEEPYG